MKTGIKFKIRCSCIGKIMTEPRAKKDAGELSETAKSYCKEWLLEKYFGRRKEISSKYLDKGIEVENESINFLVENGFLFFAEKNTQRITNDYMTGECDILLPNEIWDVKNVWGLFTFPIFEEFATNKDYELQAQGYMELYDRENYKLAYILSNTPQYLIDKEIEYKTRECEFLTEESYLEIIEKITMQHNFDDIDPINRVKIFGFKRDRQKAALIKAKVDKCQEYINELLTNYIK